MEINIGVPCEEDAVVIQVCATSSSFLPHALAACDRFGHSSSLHAVCVCVCVCVCLCVCVCVCVCVLILSRRQSKSEMKSAVEKCLNTAIMHSEGSVSGVQKIWCYSIHQNQCSSSNAQVGPETVVGICVWLT